MISKGYVHKYGDNINTDLIIPARYLNTSVPSELALHCMEDEDPEFVNNVKAGDFIVGGWNFGCGSSREHAPIVIKECGIKCVIAKSFARIFYRNSINIGLPIIECEEACDNIFSGDLVDVDLKSGLIKNLSSGKEYQGTPFPEFIRKIVEKGGLANYVKDELQ